MASARKSWKRSEQSSCLVPAKRLRNIWRLINIWRNPLWPPKHVELECHVPEHIQRIFRSYYSGINMRFTTSDFYNILDTFTKGDCNRLYSVSDSFHRGYEYLIIKAGDSETRGPKTDARCQASTSEGFYGWFDNHNRAPYRHGGFWMPLKTLSCGLEWPSNQRSPEYKK